MPSTRTLPDTVARPRSVPGRAQLPEPGPSGGTPSRPLRTAGLLTLILTGVATAAWVGTPLFAPVRMLADPGHGRGLSQIGAFDQAVAGAGTDQILQHYYPGAATGRVGATTVRIRLGGYDNQALDVYSDTELQVGDRRVVKGQAAHLTPTPDGGAAVTITMGCDGHRIWSGTTDNPWVFPVADGPNRPAAEHLAVCDGSRYRGALGVTLDGDQPRTINAVDLEDYLRGVVPAEMEAGWADQGGAAALRAQAIAARSYVLAEHRYSYAQSCDSDDCQMYPGTDKEDDRSTAAVLATAGQVLTRDGRIMRTEYSSAPNGGQPIDIKTLELGPRPQDVVTDPAPGGPPGSAGSVPQLPGAGPGAVPGAPTPGLPGTGVAPGTVAPGLAGPKLLPPNLTAPNPGAGANGTDPATGPDAIANAAAAAAQALLNSLREQAPGGTAVLPGETPGLPGGATGLPGVVPGSPGGAAGLPGGARGLPDGAAGLPDGAGGLPGGATGLPGGTTDLTSPGGRAGSPAEPGGGVSGQQPGGAAEPPGGTSPPDRTQAVVPPPGDAEAGAQEAGDPSNPPLSQSYPVIDQMPGGGTPSGEFAPPQYPETADDPTTAGTDYEAGPAPADGTASIPDYTLADNAGP